MRRFFVNLAVGLVALLIGITAAHLYHHFQSPWSEASLITQETPAMPPLEVNHSKKEPRNLSPEAAEVVTYAEYFVCWNGYTHQRCGGTGKLYFEPGENSDDWDGIWARRRDTLVGRAYGLTRVGKGRSTFWTVVFRYTERAGKLREEYGRAYVVEDDHEPFARRYFRSFHRDIQLSKVDKRL
ncbi:MAG: hypothetical protein ACJ754_28270 [Pyrinomonadaceae bacterium]